MDSILRPGVLLEGNRDRYLSATNYFFSITGFAFFLIVAKRQLNQEPPKEYYYVPERLVSFFRMEDNFNDEYGFYLPFMVVIPFLSLLLALLFRRYPFQKIVALVLYFFGTCTIYVTIYVGLFAGNWFLPTTLIAYAAYYAGITLYGRIWVRLLKTAIAAGLTVLMMTFIPFERIVQYAYYHALHRDKILFETPDPELVPFDVLIEEYSATRDGNHLEELGDNRLFYTARDQQRTLILYDSAMLIADTITLEGRLIDVHAVHSDSLAVISAIKGDRDSSEYALLTFLVRSNLQLLGSHRLPTEYYTLNDAKWGPSLWICGAQLAPDGQIFPSVTEVQVQPDSIQTLRNIQLPHLDQARGSLLARYEDQVFLTTYAKETDYLYDLSIHALDPPGSYQLFEKRTQFSPSPFRAPTFLSISDVDGTLVTSRGTNDGLTSFPMITIFPEGDLSAPVEVKSPIVADEFVVEDLTFQHGEIHLVGVVNYLITSDFRATNFRRYSLYLRISPEGAILEQRIFAPHADRQFEPVKFLAVTDSSVSVLGREYWQVPILGRKENLIICKLATGNASKDKD